MDQFGPVPKLQKNELKKDHAAFKGVDEVRIEMKKMQKPVAHYDEVQDPQEIMRRKMQMAQQTPEMD